MADPKQQVVALRYDDKTDTAPVVVAKGKGRTAERILELAKQNNIPIREDKDLVQVLSFLKIDQEIPPQLYQALAALLAFVYRMNQQRAGV